MGDFDYLDFDWVNGTVPSTKACLFLNVLLGQIHRTNGGRPKKEKGSVGSMN